VIFNGIKRQLRSVIQWNNPHPEALLEQWTDNGDEIKNASKLIVGPGQGCIFVYEGKVKAVIQEPCLIELDTANIPFWTTIKKFMQFFVSEHKVAIYFFRKTKILDQKWGTTSPIKYEDPKYHFPVGLKAYGNFSYRIFDAEDFFNNVVGNHNNFYINEFREVMTARIMHPLADYLAESRFSYADIDANREEIAYGMHIKLSTAFQKLGFEITDFRIEGTDFDDDTQTRIKRIADLTAETHAAQIAGIDYTQLQQLEAMRDAARNEGGAAGLGMAMGAGLGFGQSMAQTATPVQTSQPQSNSEAVQKLAQLKQMHDSGLISEQEYADKRKEILDRF